MMFVLLCRRSSRSSAVCAVVLVQLEVHCASHAVCAVVRMMQLEVYAPLVLFLLMYA